MATTPASGKPKRRKPILRVQELSKKYGKLTALDGLDLEVARGECVALLGHNGSGKTTALRCIAGQLTPSDGSVRIVGVDPHLDSDAHRARAAMAFIADAPVFYRDLTVFEHLRLIALAHGVTDGIDDRADTLLEEFGLTAKRDRLAAELSSGLQQRAQLACAFIRPSRLLLLDEPVLRLDPHSQRALHERLAAAKAQGTAILITTHQLEFGVGLADRAVVLADGKIGVSGEYTTVVEGPEVVTLGLR